SPALPAALPSSTAGRMGPPIAGIGLSSYPADPIGGLRALGIEVHACDAGSLATDLGNIRLGNTVMLGAMADRLPFPADVLLDAVLARFGARKPALLELNRKAFELGRAAVAAD